MVAAAAALLYLAVRPPLFDIDGFPNRLDALDPNGIYNLIPNHLLWLPLQMGLVKISSWMGYPTTLPFQIFGILISSATLFFLCLLLRGVSQSSLFAVFSVLFVALSPWFWYLTLQNRPYPVMFLAIVLFLSAWNTPNGEPPSGPRLAGSGFWLLIAIFMHQAVALFVPAAFLVLMVRGSDSLRTRLLRGLFWGGTITAIVFIAYFLFWVTLFSDEPFITWSSGFVATVHPLEGTRLSILTTFARAAIGISSALVQSRPIQVLLADFPAKTVLTIYGVGGIVALAALTGGIFFSCAGRTTADLIKHNALWLLTLLCVLLWSCFVVIWEAATPNYWIVAIVPGLVWLGLLVREGWAKSLRIPAVVAVVILGGWNAYFNYYNDRALSRNFPEPILAAIDKHVGPRGLFIALGRNWYGNMDYDLIFTSLDHTADKDAGLPILDDLVFPAKGSKSWCRVLSDRINSTIGSGGKVYLAAHVLDPDTYEDLCDSDDAFSPFVDANCAALNPQALLRDLTQCFAVYNKHECDFSMGLDKYYLLVRKDSSAPTQDTDSAPRLR